MFWDSFIHTYPYRKDTVEKAADTIRLYRSQENFDNNERKEIVWQRIIESVNQPAVVKTNVFNLKFILKIAATLIITAGIAYIVNYKLSTDKLVTLATAFGEVKAITLPDHSTVTLNGNTSVSYKRSWNSGAVREVWVNGEAYFDVKHLNKDTSRIVNSERFIVHCNDLDIEVLGTTFNVNARRGNTKVALITGKIKIDYTKHIVSNNKTLTMAPGDYVEYTGARLMLNKRIAKPVLIRSWTAAEISFSDAKLKEVVETLEDTYGYTVTVKDQALLNLKIEGEISVDKIADLLDVVATTLNLTITQPDNKHIVISK